MSGPPEGAAGEPAQRASGSRAEGPGFNDPGSPAALPRLSQDESAGAASEPAGERLPPALLPAEPGPARLTGGLDGSVGATETRETKEVARPRSFDLLWPPAAFLLVFGAGALYVSSRAGADAGPLTPFAITLVADLAALAALAADPRRLRFRVGNGGAALMTAAFLAALALVLNKILPLVQEPSAPELALEALEGPLEIALAAVTVVLLAPLAEEGYFRGVLYPWMAKELPGPGGNLVTALLFAMMHPTGVEFFILFFCAIFWAYLAGASRGLQASLAGHVSLNAVAVGMLVIRTRLKYVPSWIDLALLSALCLVVYVAAAAWAARAVRREGRLLEVGAATLFSVGLATLISITLGCMVAGTP